MASFQQQWSERIEVSSATYVVEFRFVYLRLLDQGYKLVQELGKGGFATVYQARCLSNGQDVAIKMVNLIKLA